VIRAAIIPHGHDLRPAAEQLIAEVYARHHAARITTFPATLIAMMSDRGALLCAAGLRFATDGFFSECYLDAPVNEVLTGLRSSPVRRELVFEVTSLASRAPHMVGSFLRKIVACGEAAGFEWAFFTATAPLKALLERIGLPLMPLATADRARVANPESWGTYYQLSPSVYAVHRTLVGVCMGRNARAAANG
jgi:Thermostable hemolysin